MMADTSVYSFITQPYRYAEKVDQTVRTNYALARAVEIQGRMTNLTDADAVAATIHGLLKAPRQRFEVVVLGVNVMTLSMLDGQTPCAVLTTDRFNLQNGLLVLVPDFTIDLGNGQTTLRCWG
jgi:hypothetical protein